MSPEEQELLKKTFTLSEENNKILKKIQRSMMWSTATRWIYWLVIIGLSVGSFYFIQPYINMFTSTLGDITGTNIQTPNGVKSDMSALNEALENLKALSK